MASWLNLISTVVIAATFFVLMGQLSAMRNASRGQNLLSVVQWLSRDELRQNRKFLIEWAGENRRKPLDEKEREKVDTACSAYDVLAILIYDGTVPKEVFVGNWRNSISRCFEAVAPLLKQYRVSGDPLYRDANYWKNFERLYNEVKKVRQVGPPGD